MTAPTITTDTTRTTAALAAALPLTARSTGTTVAAPAALEQPHARLPAGEVIELVVSTLQADPLTVTYGQDSTARKYFRRAFEHVLEHLSTLEGDDWQQRWDTFEQDTTLTTEAPWSNHFLTDRTSKPAHRQYFNQAVGQLIRHDVIRVSHAWLRRKMLFFVHELAGWRDRAATDPIVARYAELKLSPAVVRFGLCHLGAICANTGKTPRQITSDDLVEFRATLKSLGLRDTAGVFTVWTVMHHLGWFGDIPPKMPSPFLRVGRKTVEQLVDQYQVRSPHREVLIEYFKARAAGEDYSSLANHVRIIAGNFWADIAQHHPELTDFTLNQIQTEAWKLRLVTRPDGMPRQNVHAILFSVRAFYLDLGAWALNDSYWVPWATRCPIGKYELRAATKLRAKTVARMQQRTREIAPLLPKLVTAVEDYRRYTLTNLENAVAAGAGGQVEVDGSTWNIPFIHARDSLRVTQDAGDGRQAKQRHLGIEESRGFWTWAIVEILRHSGIRLEEMLELTHLAIQPYTVKASGETIPLVHIPPSRTDEERLIVASPELAHVLSLVVKRIRGDQQHVPLTQRWDPHERELGSPLPHLLVHQRHSNLLVLTSASVHVWLVAVARWADLTVSGRPVHFTPHDFRRLFATEALANGLPPHIVQVLLGHKSLATTQGYAAIYPQDVIAAHRSFITLRRRDRPSEEYREPTPEEWAEFEAQFVQRKLSLGTCGRAYGTSCQHEHACLRCGLLRPDAAQIDRLRDIVANLADRIDEAERANWLGEVEGLKVSLAGAQQKLGQVERQLNQTASSVLLGLPSVPAPAGHGR